MESRPSFISIKNFIRHSFIPRKLFSLSVSALPLCTSLNLKPLMPCDKHHNKLQVTSYKLNYEKLYKKNYFLTSRKINSLYVSSIIPCIYYIYLCGKRVLVFIPKGDFLIVYMQVTYCEPAISLRASYSILSF